MTDTLTIRDDPDRTLWVELVTAPTRKELGKKVSGLNWCRGSASSPPKLTYENSAQLLRAYRLPHEKQWVGVVVMGAYRDV